MDLFKVSLIALAVGATMMAASRALDRYNKRHK